MSDSETNGQRDERSSPSIFFYITFLPFLNIPYSSKRKNLECFYTRTIKAVYSISAQFSSTLLLFGHVINTGYVLPEMSCNKEQIGQLKSTKLGVRCEG